MALPQEVRYTYADVLSWDDDVRYELYDGRPLALASPSDVHQDILLGLASQIRDYLRGKSCKVYPAPFDVRLFERNDDRPEDVDTVVQPDIVVVCDKDKVDGHGVHGAPDLVIEILSPSTSRQDKFVKFNLYPQAGVREYWIVDPVSKTVQTFVLEEKHFIAKEYGEVEDHVPVSIFPDLAIDLTQVFPQE